jgi:hypothetical protein
MITGITLENFKGVREPVTLKVKPVTLLFGPNSAGKSTFLHALQYAYEIFENHNLDADLSLAGGPFVDLGGFKSLVHGRDHSRAVTIGIEVSMPELSWIGFGANFDVIEEYLGLSLRSFLAEPLNSAFVTVEIRWSPYEQCAYVAATTIALNGEPFATITCESNLIHRALRILSSDLPVFRRVRDCLDPSEHGDRDDLDKSVFALAVESVRDRFKLSDQHAFAIWPGRDGLPTLDEPLECSSDDSDDSLLEGGRRLGLQADADDLLPAFGKQFMLAISELFLAPCQAVRAGLHRMLYLGPVREAPSRHDRPRVLNPGHWATGRAAWDVLGACDQWLLDAVSEWLGDAKRLNTGYTVERREFYEIDVADPLMASLRGSGRLDDEGRPGPDVKDLSRFPISRQLYVVPQGTPLLLRPQDVGTGIAQVLPVVVALLDGKHRLVCIEQPELHIHPRVQAGLGDLVIEAAKRHRHNVLLETHSECLVLRLLRRVREAQALPEKQDSDAADGLSPTTRATEPSSNEFSAGDIAIYFIENAGGATTIRGMEIDKKGEFILPWPDDLFDIDFNERFS